VEAKDLIGHISGGRVLDVATGNGGFIHFLLEGLKDYEKIIGIDIKEGLEEVFDEQFGGKPIRYHQMDAAQMEFADESFDTVCIANSLHHMPDLPGTLREMLRILKPGGHLILLEMYRDNQTETQITHVQLHHWWGAVDRAQGISHNETFRREEIVEMAAGLGLVEMRVQDLSELGENPHDPEILDTLNPVIDRYIQRAEGHLELQARGEELRQRLQEVGFDGAASLLMVGRKEK
jgi:ubiquinone/menaquinone biosynthesis C-methylase UbiE